MVIKYVDSALSNKSGNWRVIAQDVRTTPGFEDFSNQVIGIGGYSARGCFMGGEKDRVIINANPDANWAEWETHLKKAGLPLSQIIYSENGKPKLQGVEGYEYLPFFPSKGSKALAESSDLVYMGNPDVSQRFNNKEKLKGLCDELDLLRIPGINYTGEGEHRLMKLINKQFKESETGDVFLRNPVGASGKGLYQVNPSNLEQIMSQLRENSEFGTNFMVEPGLDFEGGSPCSTFYIKPTGEITVLPYAEQILYNNVHCGNKITLEHKPECKILETTSTIAQKLAKKGYLGFGGIDYGITPEGEIYVVELNARSNGHTFPMEAAGKLNRPEFKHIGIRTFEDLEKKSFEKSIKILGDSTLTPLSSSGVIIPIPVLPEQGKAMVYGFAESQYDLNETFKEVENKLRR